MKSTCLQKIYLLSLFSFSSFFFFPLTKGKAVCFIHMTILQIDVMSWAVLHGKNFDVGHYTQTIQPNLFILTMFIGTIDLEPFYTTFTDLDLG